MTEQEIKDGNELIARWMDGGIYNPLYYNRTGSKRYLFYESWDWLMPVARKFLKRPMYHDMAFLAKGYLEYQRFKNCIELSLAACDLENVFFLLTEAIKWDNNRKK